MAKRKGLDSQQVAKLVLELQNVAEAGRVVGVADYSVNAHCKREGVARVRTETGRYEYQRLDDATCQQAFIACGGNLDQAAQSLGVHPDYVQAAINRMVYEQWQ